MARNLTSQIQNEIEPMQSTMKSMDETLRKDFSQMRPDISREADGGSTPEVSPDSGAETEESSAIDAGGIADEEGSANKVDDDTIASRNEAP
jgi:hypothetical protein